ncbi:hypothetical protein ILUMI_04058 [Ignelater luminosus]|uniref:Uncharacterized protein n=1 Tax=Ignelater luminosus TaxID=2038154 RepID=A0A8K0DKI5_IGNLU|nr:hypothetical protein ILUMI_04058 [Ignelater luminosus]
MAPQNWKRVVKRKSKSTCRQSHYSPSNNYVPPLSVSLSTLNSEPVVKEKPVIENKILYYLRRLKDRYWNPASPVKSTDHPPPPIGRKETGREKFIKYNSDARENRVKKNVMKPMVPRPDKYSSCNQCYIEKRREITRPTLPLFEEFANNSRKAQDIVSAAIEYGLSNGIVSKNGKYFWMSEGKLTQRSMTPGVALRKSYRRKCRKDSETQKSRRPSIENAYATPKKEAFQFTCNSSIKRRKSFPHSPAKPSSVSRIFPKKNEKLPLKSCLNKKTAKAAKTRKNVKNVGGRKKINVNPSPAISISSNTSEETTSTTVDFDAYSPPHKKRKKSAIRHKDVW